MLQPAKEGPNDAQVKAIKARFNVDLTKKSTSTPISPKKAADKDGATQTAGDSEAEQAKISDTEAAKSEEEREEGDLVARLGEQEARADRQEAEEYVVAPDGRVIGVIGDDTGEAGGEPLRAQDDPDQPPVEAGASASPDEFPFGAEERRPAVEAFPAGRDYAVEPGSNAAYPADRAFANAEFAAGRWDEEDRPAAADEPEPEIDGHPGGSVAVAAAAASAAAAAGVTSGSRIVTHPVPADWPGPAEAFGPSPPLPAAATTGVAGTGDTAVVLVNGVPEEVPAQVPRHPGRIRHESTLADAAQRPAGCHRGHWSQLSAMSGVWGGTVRVWPLLGRGGRLATAKLLSSVYLAYQPNPSMRHCVSTRGPC